MRKKTIRKEFLEKRGNLGDKKQKEFDEKILNSVLDSPYYKDSKTIMVFVSTPDEVDTHEFIKRSIKDGKIVTVPITVPETKELRPSHIKDFDELEIGFYNILTPKEEYIRHIDPKDVDLVIVPGLAFEKAGYRVGYGGGYYDRFLGKYTDVVKLAIAYDLQITDELPKEDFDIPADYIFTEERIINCKDFRK